MLSTENEISNKPRLVAIEEENAQISDEARKIGCSGDDFLGGNSRRGRPIFGRCIIDRNDLNADAEEFVPRSMNVAVSKGFELRISTTIQSMLAEHDKSEQHLRDFCAWCRSIFTHGDLTYEMLAEKLVQMAETETENSLPLAQISSYLAFNLKTAFGSKAGGSAVSHGNLWLPMFDSLSDVINSTTDTIKKRILVDRCNAAVSLNVRNFMCYLAYLYIYLPSPETRCRYTPLAVSFIEVILAIFSSTKLSNTEACSCVIDSIIVAGSALDEDGMAVDIELIGKIYDQLREWLAEAALHEKAVASDVINILELRAAGWPTNSVDEGEAENYDDNVELVGTEAYSNY